MFKKIALLALTFSLASPAAFADSEARTCAKRVMERCYLSHRDFDRIDANVETCKQFQTERSTLEVFLLKESNKVVVVKTDGFDFLDLWDLLLGISSDACPVSKYEIDNSGVKTMKIVDGRLFMLSQDGALYYLNSNERAFEILSSEGRSYRGIVSIHGVQGDPRVLKVRFSNGQARYLDAQGIRAKAAAGELRAVKFSRHTTERSPFRDE